MPILRPELSQNCTKGKKSSFDGIVWCCQVYNFERLIVIMLDYTFIVHLIVPLTS